MIVNVAVPSAPVVAEEIIVGLPNGSPSRILMVKPTAGVHESDDATYDSAKTVKDTPIVTLAVLGVIWRDGPKYKYTMSLLESVCTSIPTPGLTPFTTYCQFPQRGLAGSAGAAIQLR